MSEWSLEDLPPVVYTYIQTMCKKRMQVGFDFDTNKVSDIVTDIQIALHYVQVQNLKFTEPNATSVGSAQTLLQKQTSR